MSIVILVPFPMQHTYVYNLLLLFPTEPDAAMKLFTSNTALKLVTSYWQGNSFKNYCVKTIL